MTLHCIERTLCRAWIVATDEDPVALMVALWCLPEIQTFLNWRSRISYVFHDCLFRVYPVAGFRYAGIAFANSK